MGWQKVPGQPKRLLTRAALHRAMNELEPVLGRWGNLYLSMTSAAGSLIGDLLVIGGGPGAP